MATAVIMPRQGQSVESCILVEWKVKAGDAVTAGQPLASIETDKAVFDVEAHEAGTVLELFFPAGADIPVLTNITAIGAPGEDVSALRPGGAPAAAAPAEAAPAAAPAAASAAPASAAAASAPAVAAGVSPRARNAAAAAGVDAAALAGTGPGGRVIERDVRAAAAGLPRVSPAARAAAAAAGAALPAAGTGPGGMVVTADLKAAPALAAKPAPAPAATAAPSGEPKAVPLSGIRRIIAQRMHQSLSTTAQLTMTMSFDASAVQAYRNKVKACGEALKLPNITINDIIAYATARTLAKFPDLNAHFLGDRTVLFPDVNLGVAMDTPRGLMVPVVSGADKLSLCELSRRIKPMSDAARDGNINPDLLKGGTFTLTNMGMLGVETFTPVLNAPEVGILGVGGLGLKAVAGEDGSVRHVPAITLSLTIDHQAVDGGPGARFLKALCQALENFELVLAE